MSLEQYSTQDPRIERILQDGFGLDTEYKATLVTQTLTDLFALSYAEKVTEGPFGGRVTYERGTLSGTFAVKTEVSEDDAADCAYQLINHAIEEEIISFQDVYNTLIDFSLSTGPGCYTHQTTGPNKGNVPEALERRVIGFASLFSNDDTSSVDAPLISRYKRDLMLQKNVQNILGKASKDDVVGKAIYRLPEDSYGLGEDDIETEEVPRASVAISADSLESRL